MARKQLTDPELIAFAMYADDKVHEVWELAEKARSGIETVPTIAQVQAVSRLGTALHELAGAMLAKVQMAEHLAGIETRMKANAE